MAQTKKFKSKMRPIGNSRCIIVPSEIWKYHEMKKNQEVTVMLETEADLYRFRFKKNRKESEETWKQFIDQGVTSIKQV